MLRVFLDMNGDNRVDQWRYFDHGTECYRDIDTNFNGTPDEFRWVGLAGLRYGIDQNEDGRIDRWKAISAEEATYEVFAAVRDADPERFTRVLLAPQELKSLGLGPTREAQIQKQIVDAASRFRQLVAKQRVVDPKAEWVHFGAMRPGVLPSGSDGAKRDVVLYENVSAMIDTGKEPGPIERRHLDSGWRHVEGDRRSRQPVGKGRSVRGHHVSGLAEPDSRTTCDAQQCARARKCRAWSRN